MPRLERIVDLKGVENTEIWREMHYIIKKQGPPNMTQSGTINLLEAQ
jgi:hypothetical protein